MSPEITGYVAERLFSAGALDVFLTPIYMKKGRAATKLTVLCAPENREAVVQLLLTETTTFGVRRYTVEREKLRRDFIEAQTRWGVVRAKRGYIGNELVKTVPEYEDCRRLAESHHVPLREVYDAANQRIRELSEKNPKQES